jgi:menaquinone C8-methyltransferase
MMHEPPDVSKIMSSFLDVPGVYLHIPFCQSICPFCPYNKVILQPDLAKRYFAALETEISSYAQHLKAPFTSLYIGGGTPSLCLEALAPLVSAIPVQGERAIEVLPSHATPECIAQMKQMGINYISLGVQSFNADMLRYLKRPTSVEHNLRALKNSIGRFDCVDVDLIFDVSFADEAVFLKDVEFCFMEGVEQISTYPLMRFGFTPFGKAAHNRQKEHDILRKAEQLASSYSYERRAVWTFNHKDSPNYSSITRPFYLGLGAGSASYTGQSFLVNHFGIDQYIEQVQLERLPVARQLRLPRLVSSAYAIFWQAYTGQINTSQLAHHFGPLSAIFWRTLFEIFARFRWFDKNQGIFKLTPSGRNHYHDLERWVTYRFIEPLWSEMMQEHTARGFSRVRM